MLPVLSFRAQIICILMVMFSGPALAANDDLLRKTYLLAEKQLWKPNSVRYQTLYQQLYFYPLQPYLDQRRLLNKISWSKAKEINEFLNKYEGTPLDWPLRKKWLEYLAKRNRQSTFLQYFKPSSSAKLTCLNLRFQLNAGQAEELVLPQVTKLWLVGKSQDKSCDPLFQRWQAAGYRTDDIVWQRIRLAADGGNHTLLPYLMMLLPEPEQYLGRLWHKVRRDPAFVTKLDKFANKSEKELEILTYGFKRLIWRAPDRALKSYKKAQLSFAFTSEQQRQITAKFALALATKNHPRAQEWLHKVDELALTNQLIQWRIANALRDNDWTKIKSELESLPDSKQQDIQWRYWYGRSLIETDMQVQGEKLLTLMAEERHYYGFLAASFLGLPLNFQDKPLTFSLEEKSELLKNPAAKRAFEFFHLGRYYHARKEWNYWLTQLDDRQKLVASKIAYEEKWFDRAIFTLSSVGYLDDVDLRFPMAFDDEITKYSKNHKISPAWTFAIARRESSFMSDAHSSAGAKGLMQVLPDTAKYLTRRSISNKYLLNATNNINLGTKYLRKLLDRHSGNTVLATASYNAGPYRVNQWLKDGPSLPADMWIETIPFKETRDYVKSVLAYQQIYQLKVGQTATLFNELVSMDINN
ncbi:transglycosylase SLT domain-containing protein [Colwelliaceae bacterium 6471]